MKKYIALKLFMFRFYKHYITVGFSIRGNQFCIIPCIRWKGHLMQDGEIYYKNSECLSHSIQLMWLLFVTSIRWKRVFK